MHLLSLGICIWW